MPSFTHNLFKFLIRLQGYPKKFETMVGAGGLKRHWPSKKTSEKHGVGKKVFEGFPFIWFDPSDGERQPGPVIALHGGGYVTEAQPPHLDVYAKLADLTGRRIYVPYYPLAPEHTPEQIHSWTRRFIDHVIEHNAGEPLLLTGDSAGANLALLMVRDGVKADRMVLWSPWVDVEMANPDLSINDGKCALLAHDSIEAIAGAYAGGVDRRSLSPAHFENEDLPPTLVLSGSHDLLHPDIELYAAKRAGQGAPVRLETAPKLFHDYMLIPSPEGRQALNRTAAFLNGTD